MATEQLLQWSDSYKVGIQEVDEQHKELVAMLNALHVAIVERHAKEASRKILDQLADYTHTHFLLEESLMRVTHYPGFDIHKQQHEELIKQVVDLQQVQSRQIPEPARRLDLFRSARAGRDPNLVGGEHGRRPVEAAQRFADHALSRSIHRG